MQKQFIVLWRVRAALHMRHDFGVFFTTPIPLAGSGNLFRRHG